MYFVFILLEALIKEYKMKIRSCFVSNSSSSSFIISDRSMSVEEVSKKLESLFTQFKRDYKLNRNDPKKYFSEEYFKRLNSYSSVFDILFIFQVTEKNKKEKQAEILDKACFEFELDEFKNGNIWIVSENSIPYEFIEIIIDNFNAKYEHLG